MKPSEQQVGGDHYRSFPIQPHYFCHINKLGALESNVVKYVCRHNAKNGKADLLKARHYIDLLLEWQYQHTEETPGFEVACVCKKCGAFSEDRKTCPNGCHEVADPR